MQLRKTDVEKTERAPLPFTAYCMMRSLVSKAYHTFLGTVSISRKGFAGGTSDIRELLVIQMAHVGDAVLTTPVMAAIRDRFPAAKVDVITRPENRWVFEGLPNVREIRILDRGRYERGGGGPPSAPGERKSFAPGGRYDLVLHLKGDNRAAWFLAAGRYRALALLRQEGYPIRRTWAVHIGLLPPSRDPVHHIVELQFRAMERAGLCLGDPRGYRVTLPPRKSTDRGNASRLLESKGIHGPFAVIHAAAPFRYREWRAERFANLADHMVDRHGLSCLLVGGASDGEKCRAIRMASRRAEALHDVSGAFPMDELPALVERSRIFVGIDSGPLHVASSTDTPILGLYGPQLPDLFGPWNARARVLFHRRGCCPCWQRGCATPGHPCMEDISFEEARDAVDGLLGEKQL